jgi:hypothetical protein
VGSSNTQRATGVLVSYGALAAGIAFVMHVINTGDALAGIDGSRFHAMASVIISGLAPYIDYIDPKPPLLYFTISLLDVVVPGRVADAVVIAAVNVACAYGIYIIGRCDYGSMAGYTAGFLYLFAAAFVQGFFLFSEQFALLFILASFVMARQSRFAFAGFLVGLACGYKQYAILSLIPLLYLAYQGGYRRYERIIAAAAVPLASMFLLLFVFYGFDVANSGFYWTFGIIPGYLAGATQQIPDYHAVGPVSLAANLVVSIVMVAPTLLFAAASVARRGIRNPNEGAILLFAAVFLSTILVRQYLHYWIFVLPFLSLLACREFADDQVPEKGRNSL